MKKVNNLLLGIMFLSSLFNGEECADDIAPDIEIEKGEIEISENINLSFDEAKSNESELELKNVKVTSCKNSSVWALTEKMLNFWMKTLLFKIQNLK